MDALRIQGGNRLTGTVVVSGSKNASLPIIAASLLSAAPHTLINVPKLADVSTLLTLLQAMGAHAHFGNDGKLHIDAQRITQPFASYDLVRTMRAAILVLGPLLARFGTAKVSLPGGCAIGARPIEQHLKGLSALGAEIRLEHGYVIGKVPSGGLKGTTIHLDIPSVTATENIMLAASLATGETHLHNAACEPEVVDLAAALVGMGASIQGAGTPQVGIVGMSHLSGCNHRIISDRIEAGTFLVAGGLAGESLRVENVEISQQQALLSTLAAAGVRYHTDACSVVVDKPERYHPVALQTGPYPQFPTDMQAQMMALLVLAEGQSMITETVFENRFMHVAELLRLGADIRVEGSHARIRGVAQLSGSTTMATDLRASACLVLAGLMAEGETIVRRIYHLDRGYESFERKLAGVGAMIERFAED